MKKQAILIMYHCDYYVLEKLLKQIDSECFDIYLHVDKKVRNFNYEYTRKILKKSTIYFTKRLNVKWSTYSQIECELLLLNTAISRNYTYYHLISGNDLLIKNNHIIYDFYNNNQGMEFIGYQSIDSVTEEQLERIKYYHFLNGNRRNNVKLIKDISNKFYYNLLRIEKKFKIDRLKKSTLVIRKGANWFSITDSFANYVLSQKKIIKRMFRFSNCADELFMQTLAYNGDFKNMIYTKYNDEHQNIKRLIDWNRGEPYVFTLDDYDEIMNSNCFFARKFSSEKNKEVIDKIYHATTK